MSISSTALRQLAATSAVTLVLAGQLTAQSCPGDCNVDDVVTVSELVRAVRIALGDAAVDVCEAADTDGDLAISIAELVAAVNRALRGCDGGQRTAFVIATDFSSGSFGTIELDPPNRATRTSAERRIHEDAVVRVRGNRVYILNRFFRDTVQILDADDDFRTVLECRVGEGGNPQDIAFASSTKAYVSRIDQPQLWVVDPSADNCDDFKRGEIDLSGLGGDDGDGNPDMYQMAIVPRGSEVRLYVALQRLDIDDILREPADNGALAVIDVDSDMLLGTIELSGENPFGATKGLPVFGGSIYVAQAGRFGVDDGGLERVDLERGEATGITVSESDLGGDITDFALVGEHLAYAIVSTSDFSSRLVRFDPTGEGPVQTITERPGFDLFDIELNDRGEIYLADRTREHPGIRIYRAADGTELTTDAIDIGLPPFEVVFLP